MWCRKAVISIWAMTLVLVAGLGVSKNIEWDELRSAAKSQNADMRRQRLKIDSAEADVDRSSSGYYPVLKATGNVNRSVDSFDSTTTHRIGLMASQNLFSGFADSSARAAAVAQSRAQSSLLVSASADLRAKLKTLFVNGLYLQESVSLSRKIIERKEENFRIVNLRYDGGRENKSAVLKTEASLISSKMDLEYRQSQLKLIALEMTQVTGMQISAFDEFRGSLNSLLQENQNGRVSDVHGHPKIKALRDAEVAAQENITAARSGWLPELTADASAYRGGVNLETDPSNHYAVGLTLTVPLFNAMQSPKYRSATLNHEQAALDTAAKILELELQKADAQSKYTKAKGDVLVAEKNLKAATLQSEVYRQRYTLGLVSFQDWDSAEAEYMKSESESLQAKQQLAVALVNLDAADGKTLEDP
jgi:outer membrane protein